MNPLGQLTIDDGAYALDGGSIYLSLRDEDGIQHALLLVQHRIPMSEFDPRLPGRLYLDDQIVGIRSDQERGIISAIKTASISPAREKGNEPEEKTGPTVVVGEDIADYLSATEASPEAAIRHLVDNLVEFVESEEYEELANQLPDDDSA